MFPFAQLSYNTRARKQTTVTVQAIEFDGSLGFHQVNGKKSLQRRLDKSVQLVAYTKLLSVCLAETPNNSRL